MEYKIMKKKNKCISTWLANVCGNIHFSKGNIYHTQRTAGNNNSYYIINAIVVKKYFSQS